MKERSMTTPRTELDARFSEPGAEPTSWQDTLEAIKRAEIFWISTVRTDGRPHITPLALVFAVRPAKVLAFAKGGFSHTRHQF
jgi:hypothetical protein